jgi:hypothetical protein
MPKHENHVPSARNYILLFILVVLGYCALTFFSPISQSALNRFNVTEAQMRLIQLSFVIPIVLIWVAAAYGAFQVRKYAAAIKGSPDGEAFASISNGLGVLVGGLIAASLIGTIRSYIPDNPSQLATLQVVTNYFNLAYALAAFALLFKGSRQLLAVGRTKLPSGKAIFSAILALVAFAGVTYLVFKNPYRNGTPDASKYQSYYLSDPMILLTLLVPYAILWWIGLTGGLAVRQYHVTVKGSLYRAALSRLSLGFISIIAFSIILQFFSALGPVWAELGLGAILGIVYLILIAYAVGYLVIASGARKLKKIEEV